MVNVDGMCARLGLTTVIDLVFWGCCTPLFVAIVAIVVVNVRAGGDDFDDE